MTVSDAPIPWSQRTVTVDGEDVYTESAGPSTADADAGAADDVIVLCHGAGGSHAVWFNQVAHFARHHRVITWDARGFGISTDRAGRSGARAAIGDLAAVLDAHQVPGAHLVGQSMGGWTVTGFTIAHPDRVRSLTLANSIGGVTVDAWQARLQSRPMARPAPSLGQHPALGPRLKATNPAAAFLYQQLGGAGYGGTAGIPAHVMASLRDTRFEPADVAAIACPVLLITASDDDIFPPDLIAETARKFSPTTGATVHRLDGAGHSPYFEVPETWNAAYTTFLARNASTMG
jgi:3-oxoadipate enol-lactonase